METPEPFEPPPIRALRRVWKDYLEEIATSQDVATVISAVGDLATAQLESLHAQAEHGISHPEDPAYKHTVQCFTEMLEAVEVMFGELDDPGQGYFEGGFEMAEKAARKMLEGHAQMVQTVEGMANVSCIFCNAANPRGSERCGRCGRNLPATDAGEKSSFSATAGPGGEASKGEITQNFARLEHSLAAWRGGALDEAGMRGHLDAIEANLKGHNEQNEQSKSEELPAVVRAALEQTTDAIEESLQALERFKLAFGRGDEVTLELALDDCRQASSAMIAAFYASKEATT